jgi:hypothetical protein
LIIVARPYERGGIVDGRTVDEGIDRRQQRQPATCGSAGDLEWQIGFDQDRQLFGSLSRRGFAGRNLPAQAGRLDQLDGGIPARRVRQLHKDGDIAAEFCGCRHYSSGTAGKIIEVAQRRFSRHDVDAW